jgi:hypothetical protein
MSVAAELLLKMDGKTLWKRDTGVVAAGVGVGDGRAEGATAA